MSKDGRYSLHLPLGLSLRLTQYCKRQNESRLVFCFDAIDKELRSKELKIVEDQKIKELKERIQKMSGEDVAEFFRHQIKFGGDE